MSVFHRVEDVAGMPARRYAMLAERLYAYDGAVRMTMLARARAAESDAAGSGSAGSAGDSVAAPDAAGVPLDWAARDGFPAVVNVRTAPASSTGRA